MRCLCPQQHAAPAILEIGLTSDRCLFLKWYCQYCERDISHKTSFEQLALDMPPPPGVDVALTSEDQDFLKSMHIEPPHEEAA